MEKNNYALVKNNDGLDIIYDINKCAVPSEFKSKAKYFKSLTDLELFRTKEMLSKI